MKQFKSFIAAGVTALGIVAYFFGAISVEEKIGENLYIFCMVLGIALILIWIIGWGVFLFKHLDDVHRYFLYFFQYKKVLVLKKKEIEYEYITKAEMKYKKYLPLKVKVII